MDIKSKVREFILASLVVLGIAAICFAFSNVIGYKVVAFILLVTVSFIAMLFDILPVLLAAILSAMIWDFFFIPPRFTFFVGDAEDSFMLAMYFVIAMVNGVLTYKIRQIEKKARQKEEKANAVQLYNVLLNSLSHELKTPIATIIGAADNLLNEGAKISNENKTALISEISIASERLNRQVENLLNMSRIESGYIKPKLDWCDVTDLVYSVINQMDDLTKDHHLNIRFSENLPLFKLDAGFIQQVLINLLNNALYYTPIGSTISIDVDYTMEMKGHFLDFDQNYESNVDTVNYSLIIEISDNGPGFPEDEIENVFDKFYRLKNSAAGGTGLGLSIVKGIVEALHGTICLANIPEGGSRFSIRIPAEISKINNEK